MNKRTIRNPGRRSFLRAVPAAAAAGFALTDATLLSSYVRAQDMGRRPSGAYQVLRSQAIQNDMETLEAKPGNKMLSNEKNFTMGLTSEKKAAAKEFEWHAHRDHIFYICDGSTIYELGGTPQNAHSTGPGEWLAPASEGAAKVTLHKGDYLVIPRGTPHRRITPQGVTFMLIAPMTPQGKFKPV